MKKNNFSFVLFLLLICLGASSTSLSAQFLQSIQVLPSNGNYGLAVLELGSNDKITISFDDTQDNDYSLSYRVIHCNADFTPSSLKEIEYMEGQNKTDINQVDLSFNTRINYTHYQLEFPSPYQKLKVSGLYQIEIFQNGAPQEVLAKIPFYVCESKVNIQAQVRVPQRVDYRKSRQELYITVNNTNAQLNIIQAQQNLKVFVQQNRNTNILRRVPLLFNVGQTFEYKDNDLNVWDGLNEFRNFDTRTLSYAGRNVERLEKINDIWNVFLYDEHSKLGYSYLNQDDINGNFVIKAERSEHSDIEADYAYVHFFLKSEALLACDVYVLGQFNQWQASQESKMSYNRDIQSYVLSLLLKQGFYDYTYLCKTQQKDDYIRMENNFQDTENDYYIFVFYRNPGGRYDQLIGIRKVNSRN